MRSELSSTTALFDLTGKVVIVTGGSRGLGLAICEDLARHGASVVVASRKVKACLEVASQLTSTTGRESIGVGCHVGSWNDCDALIATAMARFGRIDGLINNAGMSPRYGALDGVTEDLFDKVIAVNLRGAFRLGVLAGKQMAAQDGGAIVNVSSVGAIAPTPRELPYAAAKAGLNCLTLGLARAYAPRVRVNTVMPGGFDTDIAKSWTSETRTRIASMIPAGRLGHPAEMVGAVTYLISEASSYTTGASLVIDGGITLG